LGRLEEQDDRRPQGDDDHDQHHAAEVRREAEVTVHEPLDVDAFPRPQVLGYFASQAARLLALHLPDVHEGDEGSQQLRQDEQRQVVGEEERVEPVAEPGEGLSITDPEQGGGRNHAGRHHHEQAEEISGASRQDRRRGRSSLVHR
jgi:hypothetical protein